ncbi:MAG: glycosyltransferase family 2 protein [Gemmatimonadota bacterium]|nr:glycosyltransferase family 2 protein [Gemmatimonadota bacterium]
MKKQSGKNWNEPVSIVIPTWNGWKLLELFLPSVLRALEAYPPGGEVLVVDDGSTDDTRQLIRRYFPNVKIVSLAFNSGFVAAVNRGVQEAYFDAIVLLNNDVEVQEDFIGPLVSHFRDDNVFGVCAHCLDWDRESFRDGGKVGDWHRGGWRVVRNYESVPGTEKEPHGADSLLTFYCSGGFSAFYRRKWLELGGLDELFRPFNWEDTDICYRALKRGWRLIYEPESIVCHRPNTTIGGGTYSKFYIRYISRRNRLLFLWKNLTDRWMLAQHVFFLLSIIPLNILSLNLASVAAVFGALARLGDVRKRRAVEKNQAVVKDSEIRQIYRDFLENRSFPVEKKRMF